MIETATKNHSMVFDAGSVREILFGRKSKTLRVVTYRNSDVVRSCWDRLVWEDGGVPCGRRPAVVPDGSWYGPGVGYAKVMQRPHPDDGDDEDMWTRQRVPPIWMPGDRLWVRETFFDEVRGDEHFVAYRATNAFGKAGIPWKSPWCMPAWASRAEGRFASVSIELLKGQFNVYGDEIVDRTTQREVKDPWVWVAELDWLEARP